MYTMLEKNRKREVKNAGRGSGKERKA